jgi:integrase
VAEALKEVDGKLVFGPPKTHERRTISLPRFLCEMLTDHLARSPGGNGPDELVFPGPQGGPLRHHLFYRRHYKPAVRASLPATKHGLRFHDLRHTCASLLIAQGAHPKLIQARLGHSSITITLDRYGSGSGRQARRRVRFRERQSFFRRGNSGSHFRPLNSPDAHKHVSVCDGVLYGNVTR